VILSRDDSGAITIALDDGTRVGARALLVPMDEASSAVLSELASRPTR
jgi:hypothetical protein